MDKGLITKRKFFFRSIVHGLLSIVLPLPLLLLLSCSPSKPSSPTLALVNGEKMPLSDFQKALDWEQWKFGTEVSLSDSRAQQLKTKAMDSLLKDRLLLQEAKKRNITVSELEIEKSVESVRKNYPNQDDFEKLLRSKGLTVEDFRQQRIQELTIKKLMEAVTKEQLSLTMDRLKKYYEEHLTEFQHPDQVRARQLVTDSAEKAESLRAMIVNGTPFEEVAKKYSLSPDRKKGGNLGWFGKGEMPLEFEQVCFRLNNGELSSVIKTPYGYHLFEVLEKRGAGQLPFDEVRESIQTKIMETEGRAAFQKWYEQIRSQAKIEVHTDLLEKN